MVQCQPCPPGKRVVQYCSDHFPTNCAECPSKTFSSTYNNETTCIRCSDCKRKEILVSNCTSESDTVCTCPPGFRYDKQNPCLKCGEGEELVRNVCQKLANKPNTRVNSGIPYGKYIIIASSIVAVLLVIFVMVCICWYYLTRRRKKDALKNGPENRPDILAQSKLLDTNPRNNDYQPMILHPPCNRIVYSPSQDHLLNEKISRNVRYELLCQLEHELKTPESWKTLAGKLGFPVSAVLMLNRDPHPINALFDNLAAEQKKTYKDLCHALEDIGYVSMARRVVAFLK